MKNKKYKIVVFSDLKDSLNSILESTLSLSKMINGEIEIFHVKKASEVVNKESQLSAMRTINGEYLEMEKRIKSVVDKYSKKSGLPIKYSFSIGNLKSEIAEYINENKPDIIVLGKKKTKLFNLVGDNLIQFVLEHYNGPVFLTDDKNVLESNNEMSLGILNDDKQSSITGFVEDLLLHSQKPLTSFKISKNLNVPKVILKSKKRSEIEFVFEENDNSIQNLSNYLSINHINLLCLNRTNKKSKKDSTTSNISNIIGLVDVPLILMGQSTNI
jgi:nucleotide-binding universal stress UspA family protein